MGVSRIDERVSVVMSYSALKGLAMPVIVRWRGYDYRISKLGYHHKVKEGRTLLHIFSVATATVALKVEFNSDTLSWVLREVYDNEGS